MTRILFPLSIALIGCAVLAFVAAQRGDDAPRSPGADPGEVAVAYVEALVRGGTEAALLLHSGYRSHVGQSLVTLARAGVGTEDVVEGLEWGAIAEMMPTEAFAAYAAAVAPTAAGVDPQVSRVRVDQDGDVAEVVLRAPGRLPLERAEGYPDAHWRVTLMRDGAGWGVLPHDLDASVRLGRLAERVTRSGAMDPRVAAHLDFQGRWRGLLTGHEGPGLYPGLTHDYDFELVVLGEMARVFHHTEEGREELASGFAFSRERANALLTAHDGGPFATQSWAISLTHSAPDTLLAFVTRVVHNSRVEPEHPWRAFAFASQGTLVRERPADVE